MKLLAPIIALLHSRAGTLVQWLAGLIAGQIVTALLALGIDMSPESIQQLNYALSGLGMFIVSAAVQWYQARQTEQVQSALGVQADGWIGKITLGAVKQLIDHIPGANRR